MNVRLRLMRLKQKVIQLKAPNPSRKRKKFKYHKKYKKSWESENPFKQWIQSSKNPYNAYRKVYKKNVSVKAGKMQLYRHMGTKTHIFLRSGKKQPTIFELTKSLVDTDY